MQSKQQQSIHCKVIYYNEIRRFVFTGQNYIALKETISKLFSINSDFVIKYLDDEAEYITLESQNDLMTALDITPNLLKLKVGTPDAPSTHWESKKKNRRNNKHHPHHQQHHPHQHHQQQQQQHQCPENKSDRSDSDKEQCRKAKIEKKLNYVNLCLKDLADESKLSPQEIKKKQRFLKKKERLEARLSNTKPERRVLSPQEEQANLTIKNQLWEIRSEVQKLKTRQRELKLSLQYQNGDKEILAELAQLKERKASFKNKRRSLRGKLQ